jgi:hypothetical protein
MAMGGIPQESQFSWLSGKFLSHSDNVWYQLKADYLWHFDIGKGGIHKFCLMASFTQAGTVVAV